MNSRAFRHACAILALAATMILIPAPAHAATENLVTNPGLEQLDASGKPAGWQDASYGNNVRTVGVTTPGRSGDRAARVGITAFTDGAAYWSSASMPVSPSTVYTVSTWYRADVPSEINARVVRTNGSVTYHLVTNAAASTDWALATATFTTPANATSVQMYHLIKRVGFLVTDDYVFGAELGFEQGMVSVTFDDSYGNHFDAARPILAANGIPATFYVISGLLGQPNRMTPAQVQQLASGGHEIGSHSILHPDLTTLGQTDLNLQLGRSQADLEELLDLPVRNFAYPYGALNSSVQATCGVYYRTCRTTVYGYNTTSFTPGALVVQYVQRTTTEAEVRSWIDSARSGRSWLVLVYHSITSAPPNIEDTTPTALSAHMAYLRASGVPVRTIEDGATAVRPATDTVAPHTAVNSHVDGAGIEAGTVAVSAAAYDSHGVTGVDLLVDGGLVGTDTLAPYRFTWEASEGSHTLRTVARDAAGNTGSSPPVAVSVGDSLYEETWPGADNASWPAAWTTDAANGTVDTQGGAGRLTFNDVAYARGRAQLTGVPAGTDNEVVFAYRWAQNTAVGWLNVFLRGSGGWSNEYRPRNGYGIQLSTNSGTVTVQKNVNGAITNLRSVTGAQQVSTNKQWVRLRVSGSQIQFRTWVDGQVEPTTWRATVADTSIAAGGQLFLAFTRSSANTGIKSVALDDLALRRIGT